METSLRRTVRPSAIALAVAMLGGVAAVLAATTSDPGSGTGQTGMVLLDGQSGTMSAAASAAAVAAGVKPVVFNFPQSAKGGDIIYLQGANFGASAEVLLDAAAGAGSGSLTVLSRNENWLAVKLPAVADGTPLIVRVKNGSVLSDPVGLNRSRPYHLDTVSIVPGGTFRIFGRNLLSAKGTPSVTVDGIAAQVDRSQSDETMLMVRAPVNAARTYTAVVKVDNGNGTGAGTLDRVVEVLWNNPATLPYGGSAGWTNDFSRLAARVVPVACNGASVSDAVNQAIRQLASAGGGTVRLGAGRCLVGATIDFATNVVLEGSGQDATTLVYQQNYPFYAQNIHHTGVRNLTLTNGGTAQEGPVIKNNQMVVMQNVTFNFGRQKQTFFDANRNIWVSGCKFNQADSINQQSPYLFSGAKGLIFENNATTFMMGASAFERVADSYIGNNSFTRMAGRQNEPGTLHMLTVDFAHHLSIVGNRFATDGGAITNRSRNDGESILTEGGGGVRTETLGTVQWAGTNYIHDDGLTIRTYPPYWDGSWPSNGNYGIAIVAGKGMGQTRNLVAYAKGTAAVERPWDVIPDASSKYAIFLWGMDRTLIKNNSFTNMPRGIWLYQAAIRDVDIIGNSFSESGGIYLRSYQNLSEKMFDPMINIRITGNRLVNTTGTWGAHIAAMFVNRDALAFGTALLGVRMDDNVIVAGRPNVGLQTEEYAGGEGYFSMMRVEDYSRYQTLAMPRVLGTIFQNNRCDYCDVQYRIGTGSGNTIIATNPQNPSTATRLLSDNWKTASINEQALATLFM